MSDIDKLIAGGHVETVDGILAPAGLVLALDTETTGLPLWHEPSDHKDQPHIVSLAMELCRPDGTVLASYDQIVNPGVPIPPDTIAIHGITDEMAAKGIAPKDMLEAVSAWMAKAEVATGFNVTFDFRMIRIASARHLGVKWDCPIPYFDTCFAAKDVCKIPGKGRAIKKPNLTEAMMSIFGEKHEGAHTAMPDTIAARRLYFYLRDTMAPMLPKHMREGIGGNSPPEPIDNAAPAEAPVVHTEPPVAPTFVAIKKEIDDAYGEAKNWLDGQPIANEEQAESVAKLREMLRTAGRRAENLRKEEAKPFDDGKAEVQARYNPLIQKDRGIVDLAIAACNSALAPWLRKKEAEQQAAAKLARDEANKAAAEALAKAQAAATSDNLGTRETAESMLAQAKTALGDAKRAEAAKPQVGGASKAVGMKTVYHAVMVDPTAAIEHYRKAQPGRIKQLMQQLADEDVRAGKRDADAIPGFRVDSERVPV